MLIDFAKRNCLVMVFSVPDIWSERLQYWLLHCLTLKGQKNKTKIAADDTLFFYFNLSKEIRLDVTCESSA